MSAPGRLQINSVGRHKPKNLSLISFNANGLIDSIGELNRCALEYKADIIMNRRSKGGTALYYNRSLYCCPIDIPPLDNIEATACRLSMSGHGVLILVSVYLPKKNCSGRFRNTLALGDAVILFGDFNSKTLTGNVIILTATEEKWRPSADLHFDIITPLTPTHYPNDVNRRPDILDIALLKGVALKLSCIETLQCLNSDHRPVLMRTVVDDSSRTVPANSDRKELPRDQELIRAKRRLAPSEQIPHVKIGPSAHPPTHKAFWGLAKALKTEKAVPTPALRKLDNSIAFDDREKLSV
ncbi:RNA-directed DNA polymerase from mobile element jockey [Eumeta japonica]|uniref:RNA-directed DNA polymerase from mobile element jockey n=1 Tax=Eumeta variegata TaxID=151549 RepID=A0A4C1XSS7_EUMVA|nr:RNA-directed DNA polymerase from mobile element jockey [Eumeta japonica]